MDDLELDSSVLLLRKHVSHKVLHITCGSGLYFMV